METYASEHEPRFSNQGYIKDGNTPYESLTFYPDEAGVFYGYVPIRGDAKGMSGNILIENLGAQKIDASIDDITVVFVAQKPNGKGLFVIGYYQSATVFRESIQRGERSEGVGSIIRMTSKNATLIPVDDRCFEIPRGKNGMGQSNLWYGLTQEKNPTLYSDFKNYIDDPNTLPAKQATIRERRSWHYRLERQSNVRHFIHEKGYQCEACDWSIDEKDYDVWGSSFELHHLTPFSKLREDEERLVQSSDFAVLCASCHRAVHRTEFVSDIEGFKRNHCKSVGLSM